MITRVRSIAGVGAAVATLAIVGCAAWTLWPAPSDAEDQTTRVQSAVMQPAEEVPAPTPAVAPATQDAAPAPAGSPTEGLTISSQSWRRGGLGSKALVTFTLRNSNDYAVKDIEIACAFSRRDGSHLTDRKRMIGDTVGMKARKTFAKVHVGFVNVNADKAKCALIAASRV
jgi:hypothetical protein